MRYFIVFYTGELLGSKVSGFCSVITDKVYINYLTSEGIIHEKGGATNIVLTNIIELNEQDHKDWLKE